MKKLLIIVVVILGINSTQAQSFFKWNENEETFISLRIDPTFDDRGFQIGVELMKELEWGYASLGVSHYEELTPSYTDIVSSFGLNFHLFNTDAIKYYVGPRLGVLFREGNPFGLVGVVVGTDIKLFDNISLGLRAFPDYRADQDKPMYGGTKDNYIWKNDNVVENVEVLLTFR